MTEPELVYRLRERGATEVEAGVHTVEGKDEVTVQFRKGDVLRRETIEVGAGSLEAAWSTLMKCALGK